MSKNKNSYLINENCVPPKKHNVKVRNIKQYAFIAILIGIVLSIIFLLIEQEYPRSNYHYNWLGVIYDLFYSLSGIFITLGLGTIVLDYFEFIDYLKERLVEIIIDDDYLSGLEEARLKKLKNKVEKMIYSYVDLNHHGLLDFVQNEIHPFIKDYYYKDYTTYVECKFDVDKIKKIIKRRIVISSDCTGELDVDVSTFFETRFKGTESEARESISLKKVIINAENKDIETDYNLGYKFLESRQPYCHTFFLKGKPLKLQAKNDIVIEVDLETTVSIDDFIYTQRVTKPCRNFTINFHYDSSKMQVHYNLFGFMSRCRSFRTIETKLENCYTIKYTNWILPGDGIIFNILKRNYFENSTIDDTETLEADMITQD